jgi:hypothetical protein
MSLQRLAAGAAGVTTTPPPSRVFRSPVARLIASPTLSWAGFSSPGAAVALPGFFATTTLTPVRGAFALVLRLAVDPYRRLAAGSVDHAIQAHGGALQGLGFLDVEGALPFQRRTPFGREEQATEFRASAALAGATRQGRAEPASRCGLASHLPSFSVIHSSVQSALSWALLPRSAVLAGRRSMVQERTWIRASTDRRAAEVGNEVQQFAFMQQLDLQPHLAGHEFEAAGRSAPGSMRHPGAAAGRIRNPA